MDLQSNLTTETVDQLRPRDPLCVEPRTTVRAAFDLLRENARGSVCICRDGVLLGIFTERDALRLMAAGASLDGPIEAVMTSDPVTVGPNDTVATAVRKMSEGGYRRLPVVDAAGRPVGKINVSQVLHYLVEHFPKSVYNLPPTPQPALPDRDGP